jgi:hypothetical protein
MGLERHGTALFLKLWADGVPLGRVLTLGRQNISLRLDEYCRVLSRIGRRPVTAVPQYADDLLMMLGATTVTALDFSPYEGAKLIHDLNQPVPFEWHQQYDLILDGGTLEHIFNFPVAIKNCMQMLKGGGRFILVTIANNWCGHGLYQFSPELFYRIFAPVNGFSIVEVYAAETNGSMYAVKDPVAVGSRVELCNNKPVYLLVHAQRKTIREVLLQAPQQSDYESAWRANAVAPAGYLVQGWRSLPVIRQLRVLRSNLRQRQQLRQSSFANRKYYTPVNLAI